jgi:hypothetical protein
MESLVWHKLPMEQTSPSMAIVYKDNIYLQVVWTLHTWAWANWTRNHKMTWYLMRSLTKQQENNSQWQEEETRK